MPFLSFIEPIFAWNVPLVSLFFLKRSLVFPILLFSSISLHWSLRKAFLSLLVILWNSAFRWVYLSFSPLSLASLHFSAICKASSDSHFAFLHFFSMGMVLIPVSCRVSRTSVHSSSGSLSIRSKVGYQSCLGRLSSSKDNYLLLSFVSRPCLRKGTHACEKIPESDLWWLIITSVVKVCVSRSVVSSSLQPHGL